MPLSVFRGNTPAGGRWTRKDAEAALALQVWEESACPGCGQPVGLCMDPRISEQWHAEPRECFACATREIVASRVHNNEANRAPGAFRYQLMLKPGYERYLVE